MKRIVITLFIILMLKPCSLSALANDIPSAPTGLPALEGLEFEPKEKYPVYLGPGKEYIRAGSGKASVSTKDWIQVFGADRSWLMIRYAANWGKQRIGYIPLDAVRNQDKLKWLSWDWGNAHIPKNTVIYEDPFASKTDSEKVKNQTTVYVLRDLGEWTYIETDDGQFMRGFVASGDIVIDPVPYEGSPAFREAVGFLENIGIDAVVSGMKGETLYLKLADGGHAQYWHYEQGYSAYEMNWRFTDASDGDIEKYLDANLSLLADVENGRAAEPELQPSYEHGERNIRATVSNGLLYLEGLGDQALQILLDQLSHDDGNDELNSLRSRLASKILGSRDNSSVDSSSGTAWYAALDIAVQDDLPPVDAGVYVDDPLIRAVTQEMIRFTDERKADWNVWEDVDESKARNIVYLSVHDVKQNGNSLTVLAVVNECMITLYDGRRHKVVNGSRSAHRLELKMDEAGQWHLNEVIGAEDGAEYWPSIVRMCDGDEARAKAMIADQASRLTDCIRKYYQACGYNVRFDGE